MCEAGQCHCLSVCVVLVCLYAAGRRHAVELALCHRLYARMVHPVFAVAAAVAYPTSGVTVVVAVVEKGLHENFQ